MYTVGFKGKVGPVVAAQSWHKGISAPPTVEGDGHFRVTSGSGLVSKVAPGIAHMDGVTVVSDAEVSLVHPAAPTSGYRIDAVCIRRSPLLTSTSPPPELYPQEGGADIVIVDMGTTIGYPPQGTPGGVTYQALKLWRVPANSGALTDVSAADTGDLRAHAERTIFLRGEILPADPILGGTYVTRKGKRVEYRPVDGGGAQYVPVPRSAAGTVPSLTVGAYGIIEVIHNLGWTPTYMALQIPVQSAGAQWVDAAIVGATATFLTATKASFWLRSTDLSRLKAALAKNPLNNYDMAYVPSGSDSSGQVGGLLTSFTVTDVRWFAAE